MAMSRPVRLLLAIFAVFILLALLVPYFLDLDRYRPQITDLIETKTGHKVSIGKIRAKFLPTLGFALQDLKVASPAGFGNADLLTAEALHGTLAWGPLFHGEYQVTSLELEKPKVILAEDDHGHTNYEVKAAPTGKSKSAKSESPGPLPSFSSIVISDADVSTVRVSGPKAQVVPSLHLQGVTLKLNDVTLEPGAFKKWQGEVPLSGVKLEIAGLAPIEFRSGSLNLAGGALDGKFEADLGKAARVKGTMNLPDIEKGVMHFEMSTPLLDVDQFTSAKSSGAAPSSGTRPNKPEKSELVASGKITAQRVRLAPYEGTNATADVRIFNDRMELPLSMAFYGGSLGITVRLDTTQVPERFSANLQVSQLDVEKLLATDPGTRGKATGRGDLKLLLNGSLGKEPLNSLTGDGNFAFRDGRLPGVNLGKSMGEIAKVLSIFEGGQASGETTYSLFSGDLNIRGRRINSQKIHADTNMGSGDMRGSMGFDQTINYDGQWTLSPGSGGANNPASVLGGILGKVTKQKAGILTVPFSVTGTLQDPKLRPGSGFPSTQSAPTTTKNPPTPQQQQKKNPLDIFRRP